jgi:hypothetical protein
VDSNHPDDLFLLAAEELVAAIKVKLESPKIDPADSARVRVWLRSSWTHIDGLIVQLYERIIADKDVPDAWIVRARIATKEAAKLEAVATKRFENFSLSLDWQENLDALDQLCEE